MEQKEVVLVDGETYWNSHKNGHHERIWKYNADRDGQHEPHWFRTYEQIKPKDGEFRKASSFSNIDFNGNIRPATPEEKQWLNCCIETGKFVSKEEALSSKGISTQPARDRASKAPKQTKNELLLNRCVHVTTKQQWDFVCEKIGKGYAYKQNFCINLDTKNFAELGYYKKNNYQILSFVEWLEETDNVNDWYNFYNSIKEADRQLSSVHHIDGDRTNNKKENLVWVQPKDNSLATRYAISIDPWRVPTKEDGVLIDQHKTKNNIVLLGDFEPIKVSNYKEQNINF